MKPEIRIPPGIIDPFCRAHRQPTRFVLGPGRYYTEGGWAFDKAHDHCVLAPGCELVGAGSGETYLTFTESATPANALQNEVLTAGARNGESYETRISGLTVDVSWTRRPTVGIHVWGYGVRIHDVLVDGVVGNRTVAEGFGILVNQPKRVSSGYEPGADISDVTVRAVGGAGENYVCGLYVGYAATSGRHPSSVRRARLVSTSTAHAAFAANREVTFSECSTAGPWNHGFFCDTGGGSRVLLIGCDIEAQYAALAIRAREDWDQIVVSQSQLALTGCAEDHVVGLVIEDTNPGRATANFTGIRFVQCGIHNRSGKTAYVGSLAASRVARCGIPGEGSVWTGAWSPAVIADKLNPTPVWEG